MDSRIEYQLQEEEYMGAMRALDNSWRTMTTPLVVVVCLVGLLLLTRVDGAFIVFILFIGVVGIAVGFLVRRYMLTPGWARRKYRSTPDLAKSSFVEPLEEGIRFGDATTSATIAWEKLGSWQERGALLLVEFRPKRHLIIPKRAGNEGIVDRIVGFLREKTHV